MAVYVDDQPAVGTIVKLDPAVKQALTHEAEIEAMDRHPLHAVPGMDRVHTDNTGHDVLDPKWDNYVTSVLHPKGCPNYCGGNGECINYRCVCDRGWSGEDCTVATCPPHIPSGLDMAKDGFTPHGYTHFEYYPCNGNGDCLGGECACFMGWSGEDCSIVESKGFTGPDPILNRKQSKNVVLPPTTYVDYPPMPPTPPNRKLDLDSVAVTPSQMMYIYNKQKLPSVIAKQVKSDVKGKVIGYGPAVLRGHANRPKPAGSDSPRHSEN